MSQPLRVGIAGLGTVGGGVVKILHDHADMVAKRAGRPIEILAVNARDKKRDRGFDISSYHWVNTATDLADQDVDLIVETIGGADGPALELVRAALENKKHVVTANKAMMAHHGLALATLAEDNGVSLNYEAAIAGCIPVVKAVREGFVANKITGVYGILNGTCNYILTEMRLTGRDFSAVLKDAQRKGYAEADPSFDVGGVDAGHKICLLASMAFGIQPDFGALRINGIEHINAQDMDFAKEFGLKIKLLGVAREVEGKVSISVEPCLVVADSPLGSIEDVYNAVFIEGDAVETPLLAGRGAGEMPTASAVISDIVDIARGFSLPTFGVPAKELKKPDFLSLNDIQSKYYVRLVVLDQAGVIADLSAILRDSNISIESLLQHGRSPGEAVAVVVKTHHAPQDKMDEAAVKIEALDCCLEKPCVMRIEDQL